MSDDPRRTIGRKGEKIAERFLVRKGYKTVARNLRRRAGEIDLLMWDGDELVIVEVRTISSDSPVEDGDRISVEKRRQLVRLAEHLLTEIDDPVPPIRFDACLVRLAKKPAINHMVNAFLPDEV